MAAADPAPTWVFRLTSGVAVRLVPLALILFIGSVGLYAVAGGPALDVARLPPWWAVVAVVIGTLVVHEGLHGAGFLAFGGRPRFGLTFRGGMLYAYASCAGRLFSRGQYFVIGALPLVLIDLVTLALARQPQLAVGAMVAFALNTAGACGDLWMLSLILRTPAGTRFEDPDGTSMAAHYPAGSTATRPAGLDPKGGEWAVVLLLAALPSYFLVSLVELQLAMAQGGGQGGRLALASIELASASRRGGRFSGRVDLLPALVLGLLVTLALTGLYLGAAAAWRARFGANSGRSL